MASSPRQQKLIDAVAIRRFLQLEDAVRLTGSSLATVRRDFAAMARAGVVERFRGGVRLPQANSMLPFAFRDQLFTEAKHRLAQRAVALLRPGDVVFVDGGTTTAHLAACLPPIPLRIITNSVRLAGMLDERHQKSDVEIYLTGGCLHPRSGMLVGPAAAAAVEQYRAHWAFLSVGGLTREGLFNTTESVVETERRMIAYAEKVVVLADHSKVGHTAMCWVCGLEKVDMLITEPSAPIAQMRDKLNTSDVQCIIA